MISRGGGMAGMKLAKEKELKRRGTNENLERTATKDGLQRLSSSHNLLRRSNSKEKVEEQDLNKPVRASAITDEQWRDIQIRHGITSVLKEEEEPPPFVDTTKFNLQIGGVIMLNAVMIGVETDHVDANATFQDRIFPYYVIENMFCLVWLFEMFSRWYYHPPWNCKHGYFTDPWNILDFFLVQLSVVDAYVIAPMEAMGSTADMDLSMLGALRMVRMLRLVRLVRLLRMFKELWLIVNGFITSLGTLFWIGMLLSLVIYAFAILITMLVGQNCEPVMVEFPRCKELYGDVARSMYTLFQVITLESWSEEIVRPVLYNFSWGYLIYFVFFLFLTTFGLLNIVVGVIVENTLAAQQKNEEKIQALFEEEQKTKLLALRDIFEEADDDASGRVTIEEFKEVMKSADAQEKFEVLELPTANWEELFHILDEDHSGDLTIEEVIENSLKLRDMQATHSLQKLVITMHGIQRSLDRMEKRVLGGESPQVSPRSLRSPPPVVGEVGGSATSDKEEALVSRCFPRSAAAADAETPQVEAAAVETKWAPPNPGTPGLAAVMASLWLQASSGQDERAALQLSQMAASCDTVEALGEEARQLLLQTAACWEKGVEAPGFSSFSVDEQGVTLTAAEGAGGGTRPSWVEMDEEEEEQWRREMVDLTEKALRVLQS